MKSEPLVSVLILHHNGFDILDGCVKSLVKTSYKNFEIIIVDNDSDDDSVERVVKKYNKISVVRNKENYGFTEGYNRSYGFSKGEYVVFLNNDVVVEKDWLKNLVKCAIEENAFICQPKIRNVFTKNKFDYAGAAGGFIDKYGYPFCRGRIFYDIEEDKKQYDDRIEIFWASGACLFIKKSLFEELGEFDKDFYSYYEEEDLCWRARLAGFKIFYEPKAVVYHRGEASWSKKPFKKYYLLHRNLNILLYKNHTTKKLVLVMPVKVILDIISGFYFLFKGDFNQFKAKFASLFWLLFKCRFLMSKRRKVKDIRKETENVSNFIYNGSLAFSYFILSKKKFNDYKKKIKYFI